MPDGNHLAVARDDAHAVIGRRLAGQEAEQASAAMETDLAKWRKVVSVAKITAN